MESQKPEAKSQLQIKVCGLTKLNQIKELIDLKVDFLGFIFYEKSPRFVLNHLNLKQIAEINHQGKVGVFVNEKLEKIIEISEQANLNFIQLHGDETGDYISELREKLHPAVGIIKVIRVGNQSLKLETWNLNQIDFFLFDTDSQAFGGTGTTFEWNILNDIKIPIPYFLSGGISLENAGDLKNINQKPFALDINSKFEIERGNKDLQKVKEFLSLIKNETSSI